MPSRFHYLPNSDHWCNPVSYVTGTEVRSYGGPIIFSFVCPFRTNVTRNSGLVGPTFLVLYVLGLQFLATVVCRTTNPADLHSCNTCNSLFYLFWNLPESMCQFKFMSLLKNSFLYVQPILIYMYMDLIPIFSRWDQNIKYLASSLSHIINLSLCQGQCTDE